MLKKYQLGRPDLLINTDWGVPRDAMSPEESKSKDLTLFHNRWVGKGEKKQLRDEQSAYISIRMTGVVLMLTAVPVLVNLGAIAKSGLPGAFLAVAYILAAVTGGIGLSRYARFARYPATLLLLSFFALPLTPLMGDEKGAPFLMVPGILGLYYLWRQAARKIFSSSVKL